MSQFAGHQSNPSKLINTKNLTAKNEKTNRVVKLNRTNNNVTSNKRVTNNGKNSVSTKTPLQGT